MLGSSLFGAQLAAQLGLPYAFASHFAPDHLSWEGRAVPDTQGLVLMMRSVEDLRPALPFGLPPTAAF